MKDFSIMVMVIAMLTTLGYAVPTLAAHIFTTNNGFYQKGDL